MTIKELRESKGLRQGKFAESIGIGRTAIVGYEKGKFKPSAEVAAKIKEVYGVDVDEAASTAPAPVEEKKTAKRGKKKDTPAAEEKVEATEQPATIEQPTPKKKGGRKKAAASETAPAVEEKTPAQKKPTRKKKDEEAEQPAPKKRGGWKRAEAAPAVEEKKPAKRDSGKKTEAAPHVVIQSPMGGSITPEEIIKKTGPVDAVYVRVDENKAYWVRGDETGSVDLW